VFYVSYALAELRRRKGRTLLTALGLGVGVALVVAVSALSKGLDRAQQKVLAPLTGVGTDMSVSRPLRLSGRGFQDLTPAEREQLRKENGGARLGFTNLAKPGHKFDTDVFATAAQLSFPASETAKIARLPHVAAASAALTVSAVHVSGRVPKQQSTQPHVFGGGGAPQAVGGPRSANFTPRTITGVDTAHPSLAPIQVERLPTGHEAVLDSGYAKRQGLAVGDTIKLKDTKFRVIGLAKAPLGGQSSDIYVELEVLQKLAGRKGRVNVLYARADSGANVAAVKREIKQAFAGASVTTAQDLANRVGGSLVDAKKLTSKLGTVLIGVGLVAAVLIASLLTLSSVAKRVRELGTLKALGWPQRLVIRQVAGESLAQGVLGGIVGVALGVAAAALIGALGPTLTASVSQPSAGPVQIFGQGEVASGAARVVLDAPVDAGIVAVAVGLAVLGGLLSGAAGGLRAARLRPAAALRHID
jgi:ABC-type antimicrobial peptide transport system permease subunit